MVGRSRAEGARSHACLHRGKGRARMSGRNATDTPSKGSWEVEARVPGHFRKTHRGRKHHRDGTERVTDRDSNILKPELLPWNRIWRQGQPQTARFR